MLSNQVTIEQAITQNIVSGLSNPLPYVYLTGTGLANAYTGVSGDFIIGCGFSGASGIVVLPSGLPDGYSLTIKDEIGRAGTDYIVVTGENGVTVDADFMIIDSDYGAINVYSSPRGWRIY